MNFPTINGPDIHSPVNGVGFRAPPPDFSEMVVDLDTGEVTTHSTVNQPKRKKKGFNSNLAEDLDDLSLGIISEDLLMGIDADDRSRSEMVQQYNNGIDMLSLQVEGDPAGFAQSGGKNISRVRHPLMLWACIRYQAGARNEMLPAQGPAKARIFGEETPDKQVLAKAFEDDFNYYLTNLATEYYPDMDRGLFYLGYGGTLFKKVYRCPIRERPVSECVYLTDLIVSNDATDLENAQRITHRFEMDQITLEELQKNGWYRDVALSVPTGTKVSETKVKEGEVAGVNPIPERPDDKPYELDECYTRLDLSKWITSEKPNSPYRVTIERDSRRIIEIRRNWKERDPKRKARKRFVKYGLIPGFGFYSYGFLQLLGNHTKALTALWRLNIDLAMFSTFPGGLRLKGARSTNNEFRPGPGEFPEVDSNSAGGELDIRKLIMTLPYKEPSAVVLQMMQSLEKQAAQIVGALEMEFGEGKAEIPVGTMLSIVEQRTQVMTGIHKRNHASQAEELVLLKELIAEDPSCLWQLHPSPQRRWQTGEEFRDVEIVPVSDPNIPAQVHRIIQSTALWMMATQAPNLFNQREVALRIMRNINIGDPEGLLNNNPQQGPPPDPKAMAAAAEIPIKQAKLANETQKLKLQEQESQREAANDALEAQQRTEDRQHEQALAELRLEGEQMRAEAEVTHARTELEHDSANKAADRHADVLKHGAELDQEDQHHGEEMEEERRQHGVEIDQKDTQHKREQRNQPKEKKGE